MAISVNQLLTKIENELHKAKLAEGNAKLRENVHTIKVLCELILEENESGLSRGLAGGATPQLATTQTAATVVPVTSLTTKKLEEEEANGDSLFDF